MASHVTGDKSNVAPRTKRKPQATKALSSHLFWTLIYTFYGLFTRQVRETNPMDSGMSQKLLSGGKEKIVVWPIGGGGLIVGWLVSKPSPSRRFIWCLPFVTLTLSRSTNTMGYRPWWGAACVSVCVCVLPRGFACGFFRHRGQPVN